MREIKFRMWIEEDYTMCEVKSIDFVGEEVETYEEMGSYWPFEYIELLQSVGLKDKKGVEIYEGDVLNNYTSIQQPQGYLENRILGEVKVINGMTYLVGEQSQTINGETIVSTYKCLLLSSKIFEIIGNIYETPELLHGNKTVRDQYKEWKNEI